MSWLVGFWRSSVGGKVTMAVTGVLLYGFVVGHLLGNLLLFSGPEAMNGYAAWLKAHPALLWSARSGLLVVFALHVLTALRLARDNRRARPVGYARKRYRQADVASRSMVPSGLVVLGFVVYHLLHFTFGATNPDHFARTDALGRHDVHGMVLASFSVPGIALAYAAANLVLFLHLGHGFQSGFQSLGLRHPRWTAGIGALGWLLAGVIAGGNVLLPVSVLAGWWRS
jgi:succinate dehydrogenase / fumarate reductase cytochrome b subunit